MLAVMVKKEKSEAVSALVRKELRNRDNARQISRLPAFATESGMPDNLVKLLNKLDRSDKPGKMSY